jgi:tetratricopeptide (TPR) repeat protein
MASLKLQLTDRRMSEAQAALERKDEGAAATAYRRALEVAPELTGVRLALAELLASRDERPAAIELLEADLSGERQVLLQLGRLLEDEKEYQRALDVYTRVLAHGPGDEDARAGQRRAREGVEALAMPASTRRFPSRRASRAPTSRRSWRCACPRCGGRVRASRAWPWISRAPGRATRSLGYSRSA